MPPLTGNTEKTADIINDVWGGRLRGGKGIRRWVRVK
jgi:hypothetical protein